VLDRLIRFLAGVYLLAVLSLTLWPQLDQTQVPRITSFILRMAARYGVNLTFNSLEAISNVLMFVPFGVFGLWLLANRRSVSDRYGTRRVYANRYSVIGGVVVVTFLAALTSGLIELAQLGIPGRYSMFDDWWRNTLGAFIGALFCGMVIALRREISREKVQKEQNFGL
jgi:glycopeptide antibiotics resistance protein